MKTEMWKVADLRPHPLNEVLYGRPTENSAYQEIRFRMKRHGFDERHPLLVTDGGRILAGVTRWAAAKSLGVEEVPCSVFRPSSEDTAEEEYERQIIWDNMSRKKTELMIAREQRKMKELETALARKRMSRGGSTGDVGDEAGKAVDKVGKVFSESGKTVARRLKVLDAIEQAEEADNHKLADKLTELLNAGYSGKALKLIDGKPKKPAPAAVKKVETRPALLDDALRARSAFEAACFRATIGPDIQTLEKCYGEMGGYLETARKKVSRPAGD
jgi:ParB-like chromosome segregation protein Spo0J